MESFTEFVAGGLRGNKREPFCPFKIGGYCNVAYSNHCYHCDYAEEAYEWLKLGDIDAFGPLNP